MPPKKSNIVCKVFTYAAIILISNIVLPFIGYGIDKSTNNIDKQFGLWICFGISLITTLLPFLLCCWVCCRDESKFEDKDDAIMGLYTWGMFYCIFFIVCTIILVTTTLLINFLMYK